MSTSLHRVTLGLLAAFLVLAAFSGYWSLVRAEGLAGREDNPRFVLNEGRVRRGPILDRNDAVLVDTTGEPGSYLRRYSLPEAAPVVGYANLRFGTSGIEAAQDAVLRGDLAPGSFEAEWQAGVLNQPQIGRGVRLTLDADLQRAAAAALGQHTGAIVVLHPVTGEVLAMASSPTFDPNRLEADWEVLLADPGAPLLNRATFGSYQPGGALQAVILAGALERGLAVSTEVFNDADQPFSWEGVQVECAVGPPADATLAAAFAAACPSPFADLGSRLEPADLELLLANFGLFDAPPFTLPTVASARTPIPADLASVRLAAAGQGDLRVSPLQMALVAAALANHGTLPPLQLLAEAQIESDVWLAQSPLGRPRAALGASSADAIAALFPTVQPQGPGGVAIAGHVSAAVTGPQAEPLAWYLGFGPVNEPAVAIAVLIENAPPDRAAEIGLQVLAEALAQ